MKGGVICGKIKEMGNENIVRGFRGRWGLRRFVLMSVVTGFPCRWRLGFDFKAFCFTLFPLIQVYRMGVGRFDVRGRGNEEKLEKFQISVFSSLTLSIYELNQF